MPKSKTKRRNGRPRKVGRFCTMARELGAIRKSCHAKGGITLDDLRREERAWLKYKGSVKKGLSTLGWLLQLKADSGLLDGFINALSALNRWKTTEDIADFDVVGSSLMLGHLGLRYLELENRAEVEEAIRESAYMAFVCARLRARGSPLTDVNIETVRCGLIAAQDAMKLLCDDDMTALLAVIEENRKGEGNEYEARYKKRLRSLLGDRHFEQVMEWEKNDFQEKSEARPQLNTHPNLGARR